MSPSNIEIDVQAVSGWLQLGQDDAGNKFALIDCREAAEHATAKIDGATLMPMSLWPPSAEQLEALQGTHVVVHCHHGGRSLRIAQWFRQNGFPDAQSMAGGIDAWSQNVDSTIPRY